MNQYYARCRDDGRKRQMLVAERVVVLRDYCEGRRIGR
jgi:hypothetical protein